MIRLLALAIVSMSLLAAGDAAADKAGAEALGNSGQGADGSDRDGGPGTPLPRGKIDDEQSGTLDGPSDAYGRRGERLDPLPRRDPAPTRPERGEPQLGHRIIAGLWAGEVEEIGYDPYPIRLSLNEDGTGTAAYSGSECASEIVPIAGRPLEYRETITMGRETCADGFVRLRLHKGLLLWTWTDADGEVRAAATLKRERR